mmetsp:Transcript_27806/g.76544  ORF Transcript_27806/g.76544 Transcript_27806/m.76544 type:complete len:770 (+) Transcript_27806:186-2495(+)
MMIKRKHLFILPLVCSLAFVGRTLWRAAWDTPVHYEHSRFALERSNDPAYEQRNLRLPTAARRTAESRKEPDTKARGPWQKQARIMLEDLKRIATSTTKSDPTQTHRSVVASVDDPKKTKKKDCHDGEKKNRTGFFGFGEKSSRMAVTDIKMAAKGAQEVEQAQKDKSTASQKSENVELPGFLGGKEADGRPKKVAGSQIATDKPVKQSTASEKLENVELPVVEADGRPKKVEGSQLATDKPIKQGQSNEVSKGGANVKTSSRPSKVKSVTITKPKATVDSPDSKQEQHSHKYKIEIYAKADYDAKPIKLHLDSKNKKEAMAKIDSAVGDAISYHEKKEENKKRYLVYVTHSGYTNQLVGLKRAAQLAYHSNRTLVIPPIYPHITNLNHGGKHDGKSILDPDELFVKPKGLGPIERYCQPAMKLAKMHEVQEQARLLAQVAKQNKEQKGTTSSLPSFYTSHTELMDFDSITQATGVEFIDFPTFVAQMEQEQAGSVGQPNGNASDVASSWSLGKKPEMDYTGECASVMRHKINVQSVLKRFENNFADNAPVALMHSAFLMDPLDNEPTSGPLLANSILNYPLTPALQQLVTYLAQERAPPSYMGLHIRFRDGINLDDMCHENDTVALYQHAFGELSELASLTPNNSASSSIDLLVGRSNKFAKQCFDELSELLSSSQNTTTPMLFSTFTVEDLMDDTAHSLAEKINVSQPILGLVLDQLLLGMAPAGTAYASYMPPLTGGVKRSTFQQVVDLRQQKYQEGLRERRVAKS